MEQQKNLTFEEKERVRITQEIIDCDDKIVKCYIAQDVDSLRFFTEKKADLEFELSQLNPDEL